MNFETAKPEPESTPSVITEIFGSGKPPYSFKDLVADDANEALLRLESTVRQLVSFYIPEALCLLSGLDRTVEEQSALMAEVRELAESYRDQDETPVL